VASPRRTGLACRYSIIERRLPYASLSLQDDRDAVGVQHTDDIARGGLVQPLIRPAFLSGSPAPCCYRALSSLSRSLDTTVSKSMLGGFVTLSELLKQTFV
jgi:hypothetical protein